MKVKVYVTLKNGVLEPQGKTAQLALQNLGYDEIKDIRIGKYIEIELNDSAQDCSEKIVREMCEKVLSNPVIENFRIEK